MRSSLIGSTALIGALVLASQASTAAAAPRDVLNKRPESVKNLFACRTVADATERLSCYDREVAEVDKAEQEDRIVIADIEQIEEAKRGLFGFNLPKLRIFGSDDDDDKKEIKEIDTTLSRAYRSARGRWIFVLEDGAKWEQIDGKTVFGEPGKGSTIRIKRAFAGSYLANVDGQIAVRVKRVD